MAFIYYKKMVILYKIYISNVSFNQVATGHCFDLLTTYFRLILAVSIDCISCVRMFENTTTHWCSENFVFIDENYIIINRIYKVII